MSSFLVCRDFWRDAYVVRVDIFGVSRFVARRDFWSFEICWCAEMFGVLRFLACCFFSHVVVVSLILLYSPFIKTV